MIVVSVSITAAGAERSRLLPYEHVAGDLGRTVRERWHDVDAFVLFCATGIAVRVIAPLLALPSAPGRTEPAVVTVDEAGRYVVPILGGHRAGANDLALDVAELLRAEAVVTTATDATNLMALDELPGFAAIGDIAGVTRAMLDGSLPRIDNRLDWPLPLTGGEGPHQVIVTDRSLQPAPSQVVLHPPSLVVGVGASTNAPAGAARALLDAALEEAGLAAASIEAVATIDRRAGDPVVTTLGHPIRSFTAGELATVDAPNPSEVVRTEVGTPSVAEAAALLVAGPGAELLVPKTKGLTATVAIARRRRPPGAVHVVGLGPGDARLRTPAATAAIRHADVVIGYSVYVEQITDLLRPHHQVVRSPIGAEVDRCDEAVRRAASGQRVALVCSGDPGVFAMATLVLELSPRHGDPTIEVIPGVTAGLAAASILGAPLAHDHALISLSDLLTPWPLIVSRLEAVARADMAVALYNPRSMRRTAQLEQAREIMLGCRSASTPVGIVGNATRPDERRILTTLGAFEARDVDMFSIVVIGSSTTSVVNGRMVTPRGYRA